MIDMTGIQFTIGQNRLEKSFFHRMGMSGERKITCSETKESKRDKRAFCVMSSWMFKVLAGLPYLTLRRPAEESGL